MNAITRLEFETVTPVVKRAPLALLRYGTVQPGRYVSLPNIHRDVQSLAGGCRPALHEGRSLFKESRE